MAENKNQSIAGWPSVTGSRTTGLDLRGLNPQLQRNAKVLEAYQKRYASDVSAVKQMGDATARLTKITQDINARHFARQDQLLNARQGNFQRMNEMYGNYFQQFGNVLNESALKFLDEHSNIGVPTLTAIMAGYEHAKASRAQQELAMLDRQAKMAEAAYALDKQRADLETLKEQNAALSQQTALENQIKAIDAINKSQNQYYSDVARVYGAGVAGGRGTGVAGAGGLGSGSAAGSFQAPVTGGTGVSGTGTVADGGATGFVDPSNPQVAALNKMIDDSKAAQTAGQASQLGPLSQQARTDSELITQWSDVNSVGGAIGTAAALGGTYLGGQALTTYGNRINPSLSQRLTGATDILKTLTGEANVASVKYNKVLGYAINDPQFAQAGYNLDLYERRIRNRANTVKNWLTKYPSGNPPIALSPQEQLVLRELGSDSISTLRSNLANADQARKFALAEKNAAQTAVNSAKNTIRKIGARGVGKLATGLASKIMLPFTVADLALNLSDEVAGAARATGRWVLDRGSDLFGQTTLEEARNRPSWYQNFLTATDETRVWQNDMLNRARGLAGLRPTGLGLEIEDVRQAAEKLWELGWKGKGSDANLLYEMYRNDGDAFRKGLEALYHYDPHFDPQTGRTIQGEIAPFEFFRRGVLGASFNKAYATQANKAAQNQQVTNQEIMRDQRIADALVGKPKFFAGMAEYLTRVGREAGYDFDEADAAAMMGRLIEMNQAMESGGKFGAEGADTSTGRAKSRHQFMDMTFDQLRKWMLEDDNKAGGIFFDDNERNALRQARTANDLDNEQFGHLLDLMVPYYLMKDNVNIGKFGKGNPNIGSLQALVDLSQMTKDIGISPYLDSSMNALRMAGLGRFKAGKEFDETVSRFNRDWQGPIWSAQFGDKATSNGAYRSRDMYLQDFANNGILLGPYQNKVPANEYLQWVNEYFVVDKDGNITGIKEGANPKHLDKWREENGLTRVQKVATQTPITMSQYIKKLDNDVDFDNLNWHTRNQLNKAAEELGKYNLSIQLNSGYRSQEYQDKLRKRFESGDTKGIRYKPAKYSPHTRGDSIDIQDTLLEQGIKGNEELRNKYKDAAGFMKAFGFNRTVKGDDVHFELDKSFANQKAENQPMSLPSLPALRQVQPFSPAQWTDPVVEPVNQGIVDPLDLSAFDGMMPGGVNFSPTNYGVAMEQLQQYIPENQ